MVILSRRSAGLISARTGPAARSSAGRLLSLPARLRSKISPQSPQRRCRNSRMVGYQGVSSCLRSQRAVAALLESQPHGRPERPGHMSHRGTGRNDQIEILDYGGGIGKGRSVQIELFAQIHDVPGLGNFLELLGPEILLQAHKPDARNAAQRFQIPQRDGAIVVVAEVAPPCERMPMRNPWTSCNCWRQ